MPTPDDGFPSLEEAWRRRHDVAWWFKSFFRIKPLQTSAEIAGYVPYELNWAQRTVLAEWLKNPRIDVLKARQMGISTVCKYYYFYRTMINSNENIYFYSLESEKRRLNLRTLHDNLLLLPKRWQKVFRLMDYNSSELKINSFGGGASRIFTSATPRADTMTGAWWTECGFLSDRRPNDYKELETAIYPACPYPASLVRETTAYSRGGGYYDSWKTAWARKHGEGPPLSPQELHPIFLPWWMKPQNRHSVSKDFALLDELRDYFQLLERRDDIFLDPEQRVWYQNQYLSMGKMNMRRENPSVWTEAFEASSEGAFMVDSVERVMVENRLGAFPAHPGFPMKVYCDIGFDNYFAMTFVQTVDGVPRVVDFYRNKQKHPPHYVNTIWQKADAFGVRRPEIILPHDSKQNRTGMTQNVLQQFRSLYQGGIVRANIPRPARKRDASNVAVAFAAMAVFNKTPGVEVLIDCLRGVKVHYNRSSGLFDDTGKLEDSEYNDGYDSFELASLGEMRQSNPELVRGQFAPQQGRII